MKRTLNYLLAFIFILGVTSCNRNADLTYADFDINGDSNVTLDEFEEVFAANYYDDWNNDDNEYLDDEDFFMTVYGMWDTDGDKTLSDAEWRMGFDYYYGNYVIYDYATIDTNNDGFVSWEEFDEAVSDTQFFVSWDADASEYLDKEELGEGVFKIWDLNNNGILDEKEFNKFANYYLDV